MLDRNDLDLEQIQFWLNDSYRHVLNVNLKHDEPQMIGVQMEADTDQYDQDAVIGIVHRQGFEHTGCRELDDGTLLIEFQEA